MALLIFRENAENQHELLIEHRRQMKHILKRQPTTAGRNYAIVAIENINHFLKVSLRNSRNISLVLEEK